MATMRSPIDLSGNGPIITVNDGERIIRPDKVCGTDKIDRVSENRIVRPDCCGVQTVSSEFIPAIDRVLTTDQKAVEYLRCKNNPLYWIYNYAYLPETGTGGSFKVTPTNLHPKMKTVVRSLFRYHKCVLMASRQLGKSSIAALMLAWCAVFFAGIKIIILNMKKNAALNNLATIKHIIKTLPGWMTGGNAFKSKSEIVTYLTLFNDSKIDVFYPSTTHTASTLARSLTSPILYIDEGSFISHMTEIFGSSQQTLSRARDQAIANNIPYFIFVTSTPNGTTGTGSWFYSRWQNSVDSKLIFDDNAKFKKDVDIDTIVKDPSKNSFIKVKYSWEEDPTKDQQWYDEQCQEIDDARTVNQELDLVFVGTQYCIFDDETLSSFEAVKKPDHIIMASGTKLLTFLDHTLNPHDYYLIGVDTAESLQGAYCAINVFSFHEFKQIAEVQHRYGSYNLFGEDINYVFKWLRHTVGHDNIILAVENNTIGRY